MSNNVIIIACFTKRSGVSSLRLAITAKAEFKLIQISAKNYSILRTSMPKHPVCHIRNFAGFYTFKVNMLFKDRLSKFSMQHILLIMHVFLWRVGTEHA